MSASRWGVERCYRSCRVDSRRDVARERRGPPRCATPTDTFPPAAPTGLTPIPSEGAITLIWESNTERCGGYHRRYARRGRGRARTRDPRSDSADHVQGRGTARRGFAYAVKAIRQKQGNLSAESARERGDGALR